MKENDCDSRHEENEHESSGSPLPPKGTDRPSSRRNRLKGKSVVKNGSFQGKGVGKQLRQKRRNMVWSPNRRPPPFKVKAHKVWTDKLHYFICINVKYNVFQKRFMQILLSKLPLHLLENIADSECMQSILPKIIWRR